MGKNRIFCLFFTFVDVANAQTQLENGKTRKSKLYLCTCRRRLVYMYAQISFSFTAYIKSGCSTTLIFMHTSKRYFALYTNNVADCVQYMYKNHGNTLIQHKIANVYKNYVEK